MLPPHIYERARRNAQLHIQVELDCACQRVEEDNQELSISGKVVRVFRGSQICQVGQIVHFDVAVKVSSEIYCSGILWLQYQDLSQNKYMELYLNGQPPECNVALSQYKLIEAPTEHPVLPSPPRNFWDKPLEIWSRLSYKVRYWIEWKFGCHKNY